MSFLQELRLYHFRCFGEEVFRFRTPVVCLTGLNGTGKTSILDAIYMLCFTKSYFLHQDTQLQQFGTRGMRVAGVFAGDAIRDVSVVLRENGRKDLQCDGELYTRFADHIGRFPCVFITPDDTELIMEGGELRRRYLDTLISQTHPEYLQELMTYNKVLQQRNALLKQWEQVGEGRGDVLDLYDMQLSRAGDLLHRMRADVLEQLREPLSWYYHELSHGAEEVSMQYKSALGTVPMLELLQASRSRDQYLGRTTEGIHRDDVLFSLNGYPLRQVASQGQRKSFLFGLKLAGFGYLAREKGEQPLLLLDDVFEKLDDGRCTRLMQLIAGLGAQVFLSDTQRERMEASLLAVGAPFEVFTL